MAVTSNRKQIITYSGDVSGSDLVEAAENTTSPGSTTVHTLTTGANTITAPTGGTTPTAATILPPSTNTATIILKGVTGDTGVGLHLTDPTTIALAFDTATFVLTVSAGIAGLRIYWS